MPTFDTVYDAVCYTLAGILFALVTMRFRRDLRAGSVQMILLLLVGLGMLFALYQYGSGFADGTLAVVIREALLALLAIGFARIAISFVFQTLLRKADVPRILPDVLFVLVLLVYAIYRMHVDGVNPASIIASASVLAGGIALSLQQTLNNLWGGVALQLDNTCRIGDWVRIDNVIGQIIDIRWRYLSIATNSGETVIVPNATLMAGRVTVLARRGDVRTSWRREVDFSVSYNIPPSRVIVAVQDALIRAEVANVAPTPASVVLCKSFDENAIHYSVLYWLAELRLDVQTDSSIRVHVYAALKREQMEIPLPHRVLIDGGELPRFGTTEEALGKRYEKLSEIELFAPMTADERRALASELNDCVYVRNDVISRRGEIADSLYVLAQGQVAIYGDADAAHNRPRLGTLQAPACFGEMGLLTGQARTATVVAENDVLCYRLDKSGFDAILRARPELADGFAKVVARRQAENDATLQAADADARARMAVSRASDLVRRIRQFFEIT
ncbi:MAG TPA: mechanosensitive ion channel family protein [Casimicrobiaceae bacterium]|jgi:small-conductance mechanosensitive channel/CRP-like cAMP-binding protein